MDTRVYPNTQLFIDGDWRAAASGRTHAGRQPGHRRARSARSPMPSKADLDRALEAAARASRPGARSRAYERSKIMRKAANLLRERLELVATLMTMEQGKTARRGEGRDPATAPTRSTGSPRKARRTYGRVIPARAEGVYQLVVKEPVGPVAAFTPWNFPINQIVRKLSAALAAGCSIIVKAPEETPASPAELIRAFADAGVPAGAVNLVYGDPAEISSYLIPHPVIRKISFTGSTVVGKQLAALAGQHMKRVTMELGGHAPVIVFDDADVDGRRQGDGGEQVPQRGPGVHLADALPRPGRRLRQVRRAVRRQRQGGSRSATASRAASTWARSPTRAAASAMEANVEDAGKHGAKVRTGGHRSATRATSASRPSSPSCRTTPRR